MEKEYLMSKKVYMHVLHSFINKAIVKYIEYLWMLSLKLKSRHGKWHMRGICSLHFQRIFSSSLLSWVHMITISLLMYFYSDWTEIRFFFYICCCKAKGKESEFVLRHLSDLIVILTISLSKLLSKGIWLYKIWKKKKSGKWGKHCRSAIQSHRIRLLFFPSSPSSPSSAVW